MDQNTQTQTGNDTTVQQTETKFCRECGAKIAKKAVICPKCGCATEDRPVTPPPQAQPQIVIQNSNQNQNVHSAPVGAGVPVMGYGKPKNKWVALLLCIFFGLIGAHKFYEGKIGMGILYIFTGGIFGIGLVIDFFKLLFSRNPYYV